MSQGWIAGGYFMSEEAEQAAKWKMVEELKRDKEHLVVLKKQMKDLGKVLADFAYTIQSPDLHAFDVAAQTITVGKWDEKPIRPIAELRESAVNWESLTKLLTDYQKTKTDVHGLEKDLDLPTRF